MKLPLAWKLVLGFGVIVVAIVILHGLLLARLDNYYAAATLTIARDISAIHTANQLHALLDDEEQYSRLLLVVREERYTLLHSEAHRMSRRQSDSLALFLYAEEPRALLASFRRSHEALAAAITSSQPVSPIASRTVTDSMAVLHRRLDQIIRCNQEAIGRMVGTMDRDANHFFDSTIWFLLAGIAATAGAAFFIARTVTRPLARLRRAAARTARGDYRSIPVHHTPEIGLLEREFNILIDRLEHAERHKADLAQQIAQELQAPLQAIHSAYYVLAEQIAGPLTDRQKQLVTTIRDNIDQVSAFNTQFLELARIEAGMMRYQKQTVDLLAMITPLINATRVTAAAKGINIGLAIQSVPPVRVDPERVTTALSTLLNNAVKFTPRGGGVTVTITPCGTGARIAVRDSGLDIPAEHLPAVFTRSFQARGMPPGDVKTVGVGLALVKAIVDGHGGKVYAASTMGGGSTFTVELPAQTVPPLPHRPQPN